MDLDEFSDDGLDDLPDNALQELENNAIQFTQAAAQHNKFQTASQFSQQQQHQDQNSKDYAEYGWEEDDDLDTAEVTNDAGVPITRPAADRVLQPEQKPLPPATQNRPLPPVPNPRWNPTVDPASRQARGITSRGLPAQTSYGGPQPPTASKPQASQFARPTVPQNRFSASQSAQGPHHPPGDVLSALQQRVRALETDLNAARGEASIIRSNSIKAQQQHDAEVARLKKLNSEQLAKHERLVEAAVAAEKTANTELQFLQRDFKEVNDRARRKDGGAAGSGQGGQSAGAGGGAATATMTTPKKNRSWGFADGFDEMDIVASPSKGHGRARNAGSVAANVGERTPSKGKRKRPVMDSPVMALETHTGDVTAAHDEHPPPAAHVPVLATSSAPPFEFLQLVLDHGCYHQQPPTFDEFSRFSFPSDPSISFASLIFQKLPLMGNPERPMQLLVDFCELTLSLWTRCFEEEFWRPIPYLVSLISFTLDLHTISVAPLIIPSLVPIAQATIGMLAEGRHRMPDGDLANSEEYKVLEQSIDTTQALSLLYTGAVACATTTRDADSGASNQAEDFWRLVSLDLVLLLLTPKQKLSDVMGTLELLAASSLPASIGPITDDSERDAAFVAKAVIERVSAKLTEHPRAATTPAQKRQVRLSALRTLIAFAQYEFGAIQLASHDNALPRLVTCLSGSIDDLYDQFVSPRIFPPSADDENDKNALRSAQLDPTTILNRIISQCVALIHTLVIGPATANIADISHKLSLSHGGSQRYMIALGRLTFAEEDLVLESGIESDVVEAAHELLEMAVTPDEGEIVSEAFGA